MRHMGTTITRAGWPMLAVLPFLMLASGLTGCAGSVKQQHRDSGYDPLATDGAKYAIVGFVAAPESGLLDEETLGGDPAAQTDEWSPLLYGALLGGRRDLVTWAWPPVRDNVPADGLAALHEATAAGAPVPADVLDLLKADLPDIRYAVAARLAKNDVRIDEVEQPGNLRENVHDEPDAELRRDSLQRTSRVRRTVDLELRVWDLHTAREVWRGTVSRHRSELLSPRSITEKQDLVVTRPAEEGELPKLELSGARIEAPELEGVLADACQALVAELFAVPEAAGPQREVD